MATSNIKVDSESISGASSRIGRAAEDTKNKTASALHRAEKLGAKAGHKVFAALVDGVFDELRAHLPDDIERLITSYANGLLALDRATGATDQALAHKWKTSGTSPGNMGQGLTALSLAAAGAGAALQGSSPSIQGGSINLQGGGDPGVTISPSPSSGSAATSAAAVASSPEAGPSGTQGYSARRSIDLARNEVGTSRPTGWNQPGECVKSVQRWIEEAGGHFEGGGVVSGYERSGAISVPLTDVKPGDVLQFTSTTAPDSWDAGPVHTVLVAGVNGDGTYDIIQSNSPYGSGKVTEVSTWTPARATTMEWRAWRFAATP